MWTSWFTSRGGVITPSSSKPQPSAAGGNGQQAAAKKKGQPGGQQKAKPAAHKSAATAAPPDNICKRWNLNKCPNAASGICRTSAGLVLRHVCNFFKTDGSGTRCEAAHMRVTNH